MNYFRPAPYDCEDNSIISLLNKHLKRYGWEPLDFEFWKCKELYVNRNRCRVIHMHWPEGYWRSSHKIISCVKALRFVLVFIFGKSLGYKFAWSAHNTLPHNSVSSPLLEKLMRHFLLRIVDLTIGLAYNTQQELESAFGTSGRNYILALHGTYNGCHVITQSREEFRGKHNLPLTAKIILVMNTFYRVNKGIEDFLEVWSFIEPQANIHLLLTGSLPKQFNFLKDRKNFSFFEGQIPGEELGNFFHAVDFLFLNYRNITTSGIFFLALTLNLPVIAPDLPFFKLHTNEKISILFDSNKPLIGQINKILLTISNGWEPDLKELQYLKRKYDISESALQISNAFEKMV